MAQRQEDQGIRTARGSRLLLGIGVGALLAWAWSRVARPAGRRAGAAQASMVTNRAEGASMEQSHFRPARRERLYDVDEQRRSGPASQPGSERGEPPLQGREAASQDRPPGDFRHGGLGVQGHVPEAPQLQAGLPSRPVGSPGSVGDDRAGDFGGGFHARGHVPEAARGADYGGVQQDEGFDPEYLQWREEQLRQLDDDYRAWRQQKFAEDFSRWRARSSGGTR